MSIEAARTILVLDDDIAVRKLVIRVMLDEGYEVAEATTATEALSLLRTGGSCQLLIADVGTLGIPIPGVELARQVAAMLPELPILMIAGSGGNELQELVEGTHILLLPKPFKPAALARLVREIFSTSSSSTPNPEGR